MSRILLTREAAIARITLNAPEQRNALDTQACLELVAAARAVAADPAVRCLILGATGPDFSAGADLTKMADWLDGTPAQVGGRFETAALNNAGPYCQIVDRLPIPVISAVRGAVVGGVLGLALASDFVVASETTKFFPGHARVGLSPDGGLSHYLHRLVGARMAKELMMLGEPVDAATAARIGLIREVVADATLDDRATALAERLIAQPSASLRAIKVLANAAADNTLSEQVQLEARLIGETAAAGDIHEGIAAFREKRRPNYQASTVTVDAG